MSLKHWWSRMFSKNKPIPVPSFVADFASGEIDPNVWTVSTWTAPGSNEAHMGMFSSDYAFVEQGTLCLALTQSQDIDGMYHSLGAELSSVKEFGYGTYEFVMRASSTAGTPLQTGVPVPGSITGCFAYREKASTEIDIEVEGNNRHQLTHVTTWVGESNPNQHTILAPSKLGLPHQKFFTYVFKWTPGKVEFSCNSVLVATHKIVVPSLPAKIMLNHWGTHAANWGGLATVGVTRYMWVKSVKFTPHQMFIQR